MTTDPRVWNHLLYCSVFYNPENSSNAEVVSGLRELCKTAFNQVKFDSNVSVSYLHPFSISRLKPTERNWTVIEKRVKEGNVGAITYGSLHPNGHNFQVGISVTFYNQQSMTNGNDSYMSPNLISFWVDRFRLEAGISSISTCIELMTSIWGIAGGIYGNADYFISHYTGAVSPQHELAATSYFGARILKADYPPTHLDLYQEIPDIYWLNFLGERHVKVMLDSATSIQKLSGFAVEELPHNGLGILLSPSPFVAEQENLQNSYRLLKASLAPLLMEKR